MIAANHTDLGSLQAAIVRSPVVVAPAARPAVDFADWCERQTSASIDDVILDWLRAQRPARPRVLS
jgi:hypothetical protein